MGRPTKYTKELADDICEQIALGSNFNRLNKDPNYPCTSTFFKWLREHEEFSKNYEQAVTERAHSRYDSIDETLEELRDGAIEPSVAKIIVDTKKWQCSKEDQKRYGEKLELGSDPNKPLQHKVSVTIVKPE